jgi:hypothetical protein
MRLICGVVKLIFLLALIGAAAWFYFHYEITNQLARRIEEKANQELAFHGLHANVGQARLIEGKGILLNNLELGFAETRNVSHALDSDSPPSSIAMGQTDGGLLQHINQRFQAVSNAGFYNGIDGEPIVELYDAFVHLPIQATDLVMGTMKPQGFDIRRAKMNIVRGADGNWQLNRLLDVMKPQPGGSRVPVRIQDSEIRVIDQTRTPPLIHRLTDVQIQLQPVNDDSGRPLTQITVRCSGNEIGLFDVSVLYDSNSQSYDVQAAAKKIRLSPALFAILPEVAAEKLKTIRSLTGEMNLEARIQGSLQDPLPKFMLIGSLNQFAIDDVRFPMPVTRAQASFLIADDQIHLKHFRGRLGEGNFDINYKQSGLLQRHDWQVFGNVSKLDFRYAEYLSKIFPKGCNRFCHDFSPEGQCDVAFNFQHDGRHLTREIHSDVRDAAFRFIRFPYRVSRCSGTVDWFGNTTTFNLRSDATAEPMLMSGTIENAGPNATYEVDLRVDGSLPIDEKMLVAIDAIPAFSRAVRPFNPIGRIGGVGKIIKRVPNGEVERYFDVELKGVAINHRSFPYPIGNVEGVVRARNLDFTFENLTGSNGNATVNCNGQWNPRTGLKTSYICENVAMDSQLQMALSTDLQEIWAGFRPQGTIGLVKVGMLMPIGHPSPNIIVEAELKPPNSQAPSDVSIFPTWFPYEIRQLVGNIKIGNGSIDVNRISGKHGRSNLSCKGAGNYSDQSWMVKLQDLLATSVKVDDDLLAALPTQLAPPVRQMRYRGLMNVNGEITIAGFLESQMPGNDPSDFPLQPSNPVRSPGYLASDPTMAWDLNFAMNNAKMLVGLPIENVFGEVRLTGTYDGRRAECKGEVNLDSLTIYEAQITNVQGPIWLDNDRVAAGVLADPQAAASAAKNTSPLTNTQQTKRSLTGQIYGGVAKFDAEMANDKRGQFYIQSTVADADIRLAAADFASGVQDVAGRGFVAMRMGGDYSNLHSYKGDGTVQLRDAKLYKLPKVLTLLKTVNVGRTDRTAFDSSNVNFSIDGSDIDFERIELVGDAISLIGNGRMNLDQDISLNFYSIVGRNRIRIPVLNELYHAGSQRILWITVDGTIDHPKMSRQVLPQLNDSIRQLFHPAEPRSPLLDQSPVLQQSTIARTARSNLRRAATTSR